MSDKWISVNERLPETAYATLVLMASQRQRTGFYGAGKWYLHAPDDGVPVEPPSPVTHWMDLPVQPPPPPADPFEAWWESVVYLNWETDPEGTARSIWNAAKAHYERPLPDFEKWCKANSGAWRKANGESEPYVVFGIYTVESDLARSIWNAAQGKGV